ncbi:MAG: outer membrane lipoprotein carrier protein LolA [Bdellovibrionales bacterium]|jgi:outer membrane lipoprotein-sorting protein
MKKHLLALLLFCVSLSASAPVFAGEQAQTVAPVFLSVKDKKDLAKIENYLNGLKNVSADFLQVDDAGGMMRGQIAISRPGRMRVTYDAPSKDFIIADGGSVHIWNEDLQAQTNVDQDASLAHFILRDPVKLNDDVTITKMARFPAKIEVTLAQTSDPGAGSLTLVFSNKPFKLRQWKVIDPQGRSTGVSLENMSDRAAFPDSTFIFIPPNFDKNP